MTKLTTLAAQLRPTSAGQLVGQEHLLAPGQPLHAALHQGKLHSMVLWGPPGCGKTTIARLLGHHKGWQTVCLSAVDAGIKDVQQLAKEATALGAQNQHLLLFLDEIHRFNKAQQDSLLHIVEQGTLTLVGATTENPSFSLNNALLSRLKLYVLKRIDKAALKQLARRALHEYGQARTCDEDALELALTSAEGDARRLLNTLQLALDSQPGALDVAAITKAIGSGWRMFDKQGDIFYDLISAFHKSVRGSDPDAAVYWLYRMLDGGCDPLYTARRMVRIASEDIGNADPRALQLCLDAARAYERLGSPEGELALAQAAVYLACTHKSNAVYLASKAARKQVQLGTLDVPVHLRNAPTKTMAKLGYGKNYRYAHDFPDAFVPGETYLPAELIGWQAYHPPQRGVESHFAERLAKWRASGIASATRPAKPANK